MSGIAYLAITAAVVIAGVWIVPDFVHGRPLFYRGQHRMLSMRAALAFVSDDEPEPEHAGYDPYGEPSAFDRLVGLHGYQRPAYERPGTPPPPPEPASVHVGATEQWSPVRELEAADAGTNLQGLQVGSKEWWDAAGPCPDTQWWDEWEQQYRTELALIGRCHQQALDEAFGELALTMCQTQAELDAYTAAYEAKAAALAAIDLRAAELVAS